MEIAPRVVRGQLETRYPRGQGAIIYEFVLHERLLLGLGTQVIATSDGEHLHRRNTPGRVFAALRHGDALYVAGAKGLLATSRDLGQTWETLAAPQDPYFMALARSSRGEWWLGGMNGLWRAPDPRGPWTPLAPERKGKTLGFFELGDALFVCGADTRRASSRGLEKVAGLEASAVITRMTRSPKGTLLAIGDGGVLFRSTDGGQAFTSVSTGTSNDLEDCAWVGDTLIIVGARGTLLFSSDDGQTLVSRSLQTSNTLRSIVSWGTGALAGGDEELLVRLDAGSDPFWAGAIDEFAPRAPDPEPGFEPVKAASPSDREQTWRRLHEAAVELERGRAGARPSPVDENPELARAVDEAEDPTEALRVYADWLESRGDERARLAMLQHGLAEGRSGITQREVDELALRFLPPDFQRSPGHPFWEATWQSGFLRSLRVAHPALEAFDLPRILGEVLDHPSARFLRELTVGMTVDPSEGDQNDYGAVAGVLSAKLRPSLRKLFLGDFRSDETELNWTHSGALAPLWGALPRLRHLIVRAGGMDFGDIVAPELESFEVVTGGLSREAAQSVASAKWPSLKSLSVQVGPEGDALLVDFLPVLEASGLPRLDSLGLSNLGFMEPLVEALSQSPVLAQLRALDLSMSTLGLDGARLMLRRRAAFSHLESLNVDDNYLPAEAEPLLRGLVPGLTFGTQRDDGGDASQRYASALE